MLLLSSKIQLGRIAAEFVHEVEVTAGWEQITGTAKITMPAAVKLNKDELRKLLAPGDKVEIALGYDGDLIIVYTGYITGISTKVPIEINCEDEMWQLKQTVVTDNMVNATVDDLLAKHFAGYKTNTLNAKLGAQFMLDNLNLAKVLQKLREEFGLYSFFRGDVLHVGKVYDAANAKRVKFVFERNIIEDDLEYKRKEDVRIEVAAISNMRDGTKVEVKLGDKGGDQRTLNFYDLSQADLKEAATRELDRLKYDGFRGSITAFGAPHVRQGDIVELSHPRDADKAGDYWVDKVTYTFGVNGYRQKIQLGPRA